MSLGGAPACRAGTRFVVRETSWAKAHDRQLVRPAVRQDGCARRAKRPLARQAAPGRGATMVAMRESRESRESGRRESRGGGGSGEGGEILSRVKEGASDVAQYVKDSARAAREKVRETAAEASRAIQETVKE